MGSERRSSVKYLRYIVLASVIILILGLASWAAITTTRFSNTGASSGQADGLLPGGDRHNNYAWSMETMQNTAGDEYLYVGSNRDIISLLMNDAGVSFEDIYSAFSGDLSIPDAQSTDVRGRIFRKKYERHRRLGSSLHLTDVAQTLR